MGGDGRCCCRPSSRHPSERPYQPWGNRPGRAARAGAPGAGGNRQGERARARPAGAGDGVLCHCPGALHGIEHARSAALPAGGPALVVGRRGGPGGGQERDFAGAPPARGSTTAPAVRGAGAADCHSCQQRGVVSGLAAGQPGWLLPGGGRHRGQPERIWRARSQSRRERFPATPQLRFAALVENGTHVLFGARLGPYAQGEITLAREVLAALRPGMLCLADRQFFGHALWLLALDTGADLLWRVKHNLRLPREAVLADGSYLTTVYPSDKDRRHRTGGVRVRVVEYRLEGVSDAEPLYRLVTTILGPVKAPAAELAALYHERWEIEGALAELKTHLRGAQVVLRSKTSE